MRHEIIESLIRLSKIFEAGYTVELNDGDLNQYTNYDKPFIVSYLTVIEIKDNKPLYKNIQHIPNKCIIGGWYDKSTDTYFIELNKAFKDKDEALIFAIQHSQKCIYNMRTGKTIDEYRGIKL